MELDGIIKENIINKDTSQQSKSQVSKDQFMQLLVTQMKYQDPLKPMDNEAMLAQLAQFSSLEQMSNINETLEKSSANTNFLNATHLIGKEVVVDDPTSSPSNPITMTQKVSAVSQGTDGAVLTLANGMLVDASQILRVQQGATTVTE